MSVAGSSLWWIEPKYYDVVVVVTGGAGETALEANGHTERVFIDGPAGARYDFLPKDKDGKPLGSASGVRRAVVTTTNVPRGHRHQRL